MISTAEDLKLEVLLEQIENLSTKDLLTVQARIVEQLRQRLDTETLNHTTPKREPQPGDDDFLLVKGAYRFTPERIKAFLEGIFTPEELEEASKIDPNSLPEPSVSFSQTLKELRGTVDD